MISATISAIPAELFVMWFWCERNYKKGQGHCWNSSVLPQIGRAHMRPPPPQTHKDPTHLLNGCPVLSRAMVPVTFPTEPSSHECLRLMFSKYTNETNATWREAG